MKLIYKQTISVEQFLSKQTLDKNLKYRRFFYLIDCPVNDGLLILNTVTYELLFLSHEEVQLLNDPDLNNEIVLYLVEQYFLVPQDFDDKKFAIQVTNTRIQLQNVFTNPPLRSFTILPTTGCNARCFYCFEQGAKVSNMTEQTAHDVADFIERKGSDRITIRWFGGEPLVNMKAIDIISKDLIAKNINFSSHMVSNGYLLDEEAVKKAVELWKLRKIQITLDGTEEVYNNVKNYVYKNVSSPFIRVLNNIEVALKAGIQVNIRLNMDEHNADDLFDLSKTLVERYSKYSNCTIYVMRLYENTCSEIMNRDVIDRHKLIEDSIKLQNYVNDNMQKPIYGEISDYFQCPATCMATSDTSVMIVPDGHLGKCEHFIDNDFYGSIYSDEIDFEIIKRYKERTTVVPECDDCELRALCIHAKCCESFATRCDEIYKKAIKDRYDTKLRIIYSKFLENEAKKQQ